MHTHLIKVNNDFEYAITPSQLDTLDSIAIDPTTQHVIKEQRTYTTRIVHADYLQKKYTITVNGNTYEVVIADPLDQLIHQMGFSNSTTQQINTVVAPMPGLLLDIQVSVGQEVQQDDHLLVLEAMKMENILTAPRNGVIKSIEVAVGATVDKGQLLIEFEA